MNRACWAAALTLICAAVPAAAAADPVAHAAAVGTPPGSTQLQLVFPLAADTRGLERFALSVSTPGSPDYRQYQPLSRLSRWFGASTATRKRVVRYLRAVGARHVRIDGTGLFAAATMSVALSQRVFDTELARFRARDGTRFIAPIAASAAGASERVPAALRGAVRGVVGLDTRPLASRSAVERSIRARARASLAGVPSDYPTRTGTAASFCGAVQGFTPNQYLTAYDFDPLHNANVVGQGVTVALIEIDGFKDSDIDSFAHCFHLGVPALNAYGVGLSHPLRPGGESTLDLEVLTAAAPGLKRIDVYESNASAANTLTAMTAPLTNRGHHPQIVSASLGLCEADVLGAINRSGLDSAEASLAAAAATGITYLASSGDSGSADCTDGEGNPLHRLAVNYPASSWWVTGVGGTNFILNPDNTLATQFVWNDGTDQPGSAGGGGFSNQFGRPSYQQGAVSVNRRAVPDVSMLADIAPGYAIYCTAKGDCSPSDPWTTVGGTSAATPLLAGGFAIVDQQLRASGKQDLGLVNPLLYSLGGSSLASTVFSDVTTGNNDVFGPVGGLSGNQLGCCSAGPGFDEASGLGSVDINNFEQVAIARQPPIVGVTLFLPAHQRPLASHRISATVRCSAACMAGAFALIKVGSARSFEVDSNIVNLAGEAGAPVSLRLSGRQLSKLRAGRNHHKRITATVYGVVFDQTVYSVIRVPSEAIHAQTRGKRLKI
jgi:kumamolisin